ncbi:hypothetical protein TCAL_11130 [Tigriopus californicus]|uniref:Lysosomal protein NCU-G1 n=1 Tax=Tigriopus californicus TaxID=6832 RepID=A0A553NPG6_TIGCA|nr:glycosylated lysosomal membrane protein A-like [Tigriopus californicus]TRY67324.1 hypothetical protein TCAL_11130 [Tigriopus californicus]
MALALDFCLLWCFTCLVLPVEPLDLLPSVTDDGISYPTHDIKHTLESTFNPGCLMTTCNRNGSVSVFNLTIVDDPVQAQEHHWVWSVIKHPTIQVALTPPGDRVRIDWGALFGFGDMASAIDYENAPDYSAAIMLANLIEFDDQTDNAFIHDEKPSVLVYPLLNFNWKRVMIENTTQRLAYGFIGQNYSSAGASHPHNITGTLNITLASYAQEGYGVWLPHLSHSEGTNQFDIQLQELKSTSGFQRSRFALEFYIVSQATREDKLRRVATRTLDDEHTPGIFKTQELIIPGYNESLQAFLQWRPVVYTTRERDLSGSTDVNVTNAIRVTNASDELATSILYAMYGMDLDDMLVFRINVTLGGPKDGFYKKTKYQAWTFTIGTGEPIRNGFSPMIILVMTIIFGILLLVGITAIVICIVKRVKRRQPQQNAYGRLQN